MKMTGVIQNLPWHVNVDAEGYQETSESIEDHYDEWLDAEQEFGALFYAGIANLAADMLEFPRGVRAEVPEAAQGAAERFVEQVAWNHGKGTAQALYGLTADAHDVLSAYEDSHGEENVEPLDEHISEIRSRWRSTRQAKSRSRRLCYTTEMTFQFRRQQRNRFRVNIAPESPRGHSGQSVDSRSESHLRMERISSQRSA